MSEENRELWARCLLNIERHVRPQSFDTWFRPTRVGRFGPDLLEIEVSSSYFADWVESNYLSLIQKAVEEETGLAPRVIFSVAGDGGKGRGSSSPPLAAEDKAPPPAADGTAGAEAVSASAPTAVQRTAEAQ